MQLSLLTPEVQPQLQLSGCVISPQLAKLLKNIRVTEHDNEYHADIPKLDRKHYEEFKKFISGLRGYWSRSKNTHIFAYDPTAKIAQCLAAGKYPEPNPNAFFPTPDKLIDDMFVESRLAEFKFVGHEITGLSYSFQHPDDTHWQTGLKFLEPSAGTGAIAKRIRKAFPLAQLDVFEVDEFNRDILTAQNFNVIGDDFLTAVPTAQYDFVFMNPPFSIKRNKHAYIDHIERAFDYWVEPGRTLVAIAPASLLWDSSTKAIDFHNKVALYGSWDLNPKESFKDSGTTIDTIVIQMVKHSDETLADKFECDNGYSSWPCYNICLWLESQDDYRRNFLNRMRDKVSSTHKLDILHEIGLKVDSIVARLIKEGTTLYYSPLVRQQVIGHQWDEITEE